MSVSPDTRLGICKKRAQAAGDVWMPLLEAKRGLKGESIHGNVIEPVSKQDCLPSRAGILSLDGMSMGRPP